MKGLERIKPTNLYFKDALKYKNHRLIDRSDVYNHDTAGRIHKWQTRLKVQMDMKLFDPKDPVAIPAFLTNFKTACDALGIHEGAAMWLFKPFMRESAKSALNMRICPSDQSSVTKKGKLASYSAVVNYLLMTYAYDDIIAKAEAELHQFKQGTKTSEQDYATALTLKVMRCGPVYN